MNVQVGRSSQCFYACRSKSVPKRVQYAPLCFIFFAIFNLAFMYPQNVTKYSPNALLAKCKILWEKANIAVFDLDPFCLNIKHHDSGMIVFYQLITATNIINNKTKKENNKQKRTSPIINEIRYIKRNCLIIIIETTFPNEFALFPQHKLK